jgi:transposase
MKNITLLGIDVAKNVFQLHGVDRKGNDLLKKRLTRNKLMEFIVQLPKCCIVMEACSGTYYWSRRFQELGHEVKLISAQFVKPFVQGNKTDRNDAKAIVEAAQRPDMRIVPVKSIEQQDIQSILRIREQLIEERTALSNQIRGLLTEYGIVITKGLASLRKVLPEILEENENDLSFLMRKHLQRMRERLKDLDDEVASYNQEVQTIYNASEPAKRIGKIEGVGTLTAVAILSLGNLNVFKNGRHFSAFLGLVPRESSSGNKQRLLGISKRGNKYLRWLLIHGGRSVVMRTDKKEDRKSQWINSLKERRGNNRAACAVANKNARSIWAVMTKEEIYQAEKGLCICA